MALAICTGCTTAYAPGTPRCPQCGSTEHVEQGSAGHLELLAPKAAPVKAKTKPAGGSDADS